MSKQDKKAAKAAKRNGNTTSAQESSGAKTTAESTKTPAPVEQVESTDPVAEPTEPTEPAESIEGGDEEAVAEAQPEFRLIPLSEISPYGNVRRNQTLSEKKARSEHTAAIVKSLLQNHGKNLNCTGLEQPISAYPAPTENPEGGEAFSYQLRAGFTRLAAFKYIFGLSDEDAAKLAEEFGLPPSFRSVYAAIPTLLRSQAPSTTDRIRAMLVENDDETRRGLTAMDMANAIELLSKEHRRVPKGGKPNAETVVDYDVIAMYFPHHTSNHLRQLHTLLSVDERVQDAVNAGWLNYTDAVRLNKTPTAKVAEVLSVYKDIVEGKSTMTKKQWAELVSTINQTANPDEVRGRKKNPAKEDAAAAKVAEKALGLDKKPAGEGEGEEDDDDDAAEGAEGAEGAESGKTDKKEKKAEGKKPAGPGAGENLLASMLSGYVADAGLADEVNVQANRTADGKSSVSLIFATESSAIVCNGLAELFGASDEIKATIAKLMK